MKNFLRSLRYLRPYRVRIAIAVLCVICIASLWAGGLGMMLPGAKILISDEGLHGWAYLSLVNDRMEAKLVGQKTPPGAAIEENGVVRQIDTVVNVVGLKKDGIAQKAGLLASDWIIGVNDGEGLQRLRDDLLIRHLAQLQQGQEVTLSVVRAGSNHPHTITLAMGEAKLASRALGKVAAWIPDPGPVYAKRFNMFLGLLVAVFVITILRGLFTFLQEYFVGTAIWQGIMDLRCDNYNAVLHLPTTFFSEKGVSDATSRFVSDTGELARGQNTLLGKTLVEPAKAVASIFIALYWSWKLTIIALIAGPPAYYFIRRFGKKMHRASKRALESWSSMLGVLAETLQGIRVVKAYTMEGRERKRFFQVNRQLLRQQNRMERLDAATSPTMESLGIVTAIVAAGAAGYLVFNYKMDRDVFLVWMAALFAMFDPVRKLAKVSMRFQASEAAAARIFELQDAPREVIRPLSQKLPRHTRSLEFRNVCYRYPSASVDAVRNVNLKILAGQTVAIVGPNGSGKTTLLSLVPRLLDATSGQVLIDGVDVMDVTLRSLRSQIGLVTQDTVLFHATIAENISYGLRRVDRQTVIEAAQKAFVHEFVQEMPDGYDTIVGEHGATLSGGQKQRISIARAILRDPAIMIFDEAMSQVDSDSEHRIHQAMEGFTKGRTTLVIAHRFATVLSADIIAVMQDGMLVDAGTHKQLLDRCRLYQHLYSTQFMDGGGVSAVRT
ncbi:MAG: ATP-binding cassette domain-containing protein [Planctomycetes bacterium]|nr:ATP-binding cassette domain-containing protein [Planctomycetota bacterium]